MNCSLKRPFPTTAGTSGGQLWQSHPHHRHLN